MRCNVHSDDKTSSRQPRERFSSVFFSSAQNESLFTLAEGHLITVSVSHSLPSPLPNFGLRPSKPKSKGRLALWPSPEGLPRSLSRHALMEVEGDLAVRKLASRTDGGAFSLVRLLARIA